MLLFLVDLINIEIFRISFSFFYSFSFILRSRATSVWYQSITSIRDQVIILPCISLVSEPNFDPRSSYSPTSFDSRSFRPLFRRTFSPPFIPTPTRSFPTFPLPPHLKVSTFFGRRDISSSTNEIRRRQSTSLDLNIGISKK